MKTYQLVTIADLLKVPPDRREDCLRELAYGLEFLDLMAGDEAEVSESGFTWCDDGIKKTTVDLNGETLTLCIDDGKGAA